MSVPPTSDESSEPTHNWRFGALYFLSFAAIALPGIYLNLFLERRGVSKIQLGMLGAMGAWVGAFAPMFWGFVSDRIQRRKPPIIVMHWATAFLLPLIYVFGDRSFWWLALLYVAFIFFFRPAISLTDAWSLNHVERTGGDYGHVRMWGSFGFAAPLLASLFLLRGSSVSDASALLPVFIGFCAFRVLSGFFTMTMPDEPITGARPKMEWRALRPYLHPFALTFFFAAFAGSFLFNPYYTFFSIYLDQIGIADRYKGMFWVVAVVAESGLIAVSGAFLRRFGRVPLLVTGIAAMSARLFIYAATPSWQIVLVTQTLHAFTFGGFHVAAMQTIQRITPPAFRASGQTMYTSLMGVGGILGGMIGGIIAEEYGIPYLFRVLAIAAAGVSVLVMIGFTVFREDTPLAATADTENDG
ncbi:MAG: MFS transporter [Planctomycetota bacterium]|nr:MFS transporter [Planctomycetota bacterium]